MYKYIKLWSDEYGKGRPEDKRALGDYIECETDQCVRGLRNELVGVSKGNYIPETLDVLIGKNRMTRHGTYDEWAKLMLQWLASLRK